MALADLVQNKLGYYTVHKLHHSITVVKYGAYETTTVSKWFRTAHSVTTWVFIDLLLYQRYTGNLDGHYPTTATV